MGLPRDAPIVCQDQFMKFGRRNSGQNSDEPLDVEGKLLSSHAFRNVGPLTVDRQISGKSAWVATVWL
jgi:hypothetical protein